MKLTLFPVYVIFWETPYAVTHLRIFNFGVPLTCIKHVGLSTFSEVFHKKCILRESCVCYAAWLQIFLKFYKPCCFVALSLFHSLLQFVV